MPSKPRRLTSLATTLVVLAGAGLVACGDGGSDGSTSVSVPQIAQGSGSGSGAVVSESGATPAGGTGEVPAVTTATAADLSEPTDLVVRPGDDDLWVAERAGTIRRLTVSQGGAALATDGDVILDISDETTTDSERGLLGITFDDSGDTLFVSSTDADGNTRIVSYPVVDDAVDPSAVTVLFTVAQPFSNHNGGHIVLGPDGMLWLGLGDGGAADDPGNRAQDPSTPLGKMLRIDPTGSAEPEIVMSGIRNPWRFSFDTDGSLWIGDVGQNAWEEIDHLAPDDIDGANLGWSGFEGTHANTNVDPAGRIGTDPVAPVFEYSHDGGNCSITGGFVYRGTAIEGLQGAYLFADYCAGRLRAVRIDDQGAFAQELDLGVDIANPVSFAADADGEPYVLSGSGTIERLIPA